MRSYLTAAALAACLTVPAYAQEPADTTLSIRNIDVQGWRSAGLSGGVVKRLQVEENPGSLGLTAADAIRRIPSVMTDIEGEVLFRGAARAGLLLEGVPYGMLDEQRGDLLIQLPALFFNRLLVTSFPPIEWVPDGEAGTMNLAASSWTAADSPLQLTLAAGWQERYDAGAAVNLHPGRFHITGKYNYRREYRARTFYKSTTTEKNRTEMDNRATARPDVHLADLRIGYDATARDHLTLYGLYNRMDYSRYGRINNRVFNPRGEQMKYVIRNRYNDQLQEAYAAEARWSHTFSHPGSRLDFTFNYNNFAYDEDNDYKNENPANGKIVAEDNLFVRQEKHAFYWSADYRGRSGGWQWQAGYIGRARREHYATDAAALSAAGGWTPNVQKSYGYGFQRLLNLLYFSAGKRWDRLAVEAGVQGELSHRTVDGEAQDRFHLYPRLRLGYNLHRGGDLSLSYVQRTIRPYGASLNPHVDYSDATHLVQGNPALQDEFVHQLELGYRWERPGFYVAPALYYRNRQNRIMEVAFQEGEETLWRKENMGRSRTAGVELSAGWNPWRFLSIGFAGNLYRDEIDGRTVGYGETKSLVCGDLKGNLAFHLSPATELQLDAFYITDRLTPQGKILSRYSVNAGLSHYFLQRKLRATLSVSDLFDSLGETTLIDTPALQMRQVRDRDARVAWLVLTYCL